MFKHIDNSPLIVFRILFGLLCLLESVGAIFTGWVNYTLIDPQFTFSFIGLDWLQPLPGFGMYVYYVVMGLFGFMIMIGYRYRFSASMFTIMWAMTYFMQKASYNNHYYLLILLSAFMIIQPAHRYYSVDAKRNPKIKSISMPQWCSWIFIIQMFIVYTYGSIAKIYPDWLNISVMESMMQAKQHYYVIGELLQERWVHYFLAYGGILFDGLVIPALLWKPTRKLAFFASIFFHMFNSIVFQVGIFPYLSLAFILFFYEPQTIRNIFLKKKPYYDLAEIRTPRHSGILVTLFSLYFLIQIALPLRHHFIEDNVLWTEEGHRMSWRMMLRSKHGYATYKIINKADNSRISINLEDYLSKKQKRLASTKPDVIWQFAQRLKKEHAQKGIDISVFVDCRISVNGRPLERLINPDVDIAAQKWDPFRHSAWILPSKLE